MPIFFNSLRSQILAFAAGLTSLTLSAILLVVLVNTGNATKLSVNEDIDMAVEAFQGTIDARRDQLLGAAQILVSDFGFKQAVASNDSGTVGSMLENHGARINSDLMFLSDLDGRIIASTNSDILEGSKFAYKAPFMDALQGEMRADFYVLGEHIYQLLLIPVKAPRVVAIAGVGFEMNEDLARVLGNGSGVDVTFIEKTDTESNSNQSWAYATTLPSLEAVGAALRAPESVQSLIRLPFETSQRYASRMLDISSNQESAVQVVLTEDLTHFYEEYEELTSRILQIAVVIVILAILGSTLIANGLTEPLKALVIAAQSIAKGDYQLVAPPKRGSYEIQTLISAFRTMNVDLAEREKKIVYQATHDSLTGLLNRDSMLASIERFVEKNKPFVLMGINLRGFKSINDSLGIEVGDTCLVNIAQRIKATALDGVSARLSADEFCLILAAREDQTENDTRLMCMQILNALSAPMQINGISLSIDARAGAIAYPEQADTAKLLVRRGNIANEHAIAINERLYVYQEGQDKVHLRKLKILRSLKEALQKDDGQLQMHYQPKMNLRTGEVEKSEALIRWFHPDDGFIPPDLFIELAEQTGLIGLVTAWVISRVLDDQARLKRDGIAMQVSINISAQDLSDDGLKFLIEQKLQQNNLEAHDVCLEITERDMMTDVDKSLALLNYFRERGFQISMDDYGIGYSALSKLAQMPLNELKIDKCFILKLATQKDDQIIVRNTITMAHELGLSVIAEGVEDLESKDWLREAGCDYIQGYYLARPMACDALVTWLDEFKTAEKAE